MTIAIRRKRIALFPAHAQIPPLSINFAALADGAVPAQFYAPTWSIQNSKLVNTPTLGAESLTNGNMETGNPPSNWTSIGSCVLAQVSDGGSNVLSIAPISNYTGAQNVTAAAAVGAWYLSVAVVRVVSGGGQVYLNVSNGGNSVNSDIISAATYTTIAVAMRAAAATDVRQKIISTLAGNVCYADNDSVKAMSLATLFNSLNARISGINLIAPVISTLATATQAGIVICLDSATSPQNFVLAYCDGLGNVKIEKCVAGTYTPLSTVATTYGATKYFSAKKSGSSISIYYGTTDFGTLIATVTVPDASIVNNVRHGLFSTYSGNQFAGLFSVAPYS
jgi:hypothetical protein